MPCDTHTHTSSAASDARIRYDVQKAEAYQACLATELQQHFIPLLQQELNVDVFCAGVMCTGKTEVVQDVTLHDLDSLVILTFV